MRLFRTIFWSLLFAFMTFCFFVAFEYGFTPAQFREGASLEWGRIKSSIPFVNSAVDKPSATPKP